MEQGLQDPAAAQQTPLQPGARTVGHTWTQLTLALGQLLGWGTPQEEKMAL